MLYQPTLVSRDFYAVVKKTIPEALSEPRFARFLDHLMFSDFRDEETGYTVSPETLLADMEGMSAQLQSRNYGRALKFPGEFEEATGLTLLRRPSGYHYRTGRASCYALSSLPEPVQEALGVELLNPVQAYSQGVYLVRGKTPTKADLNAKRDQFIQRKEAYMARTDIPRSDVQFLNLSSRNSTFLYRGIEKRLGGALTAVSKLPRGEKRARALRTLVKLPTFEPFYEAKGNTQRIYTNGTSLQNLPAGMRKAILQPSKNYDLSAAQLAIMATHWKVPEVQGLVSEGKAWETFCCSLGLPFHPGTVGEIKALVYSTAFGMTENNLAIKLGIALRALDENANAFTTPPETIQHFSEVLSGNPYLGALLAGRRRALKRITSTGIVTDGDGAPHGCNDFEKSFEGGQLYRTMLAFEMQSREKWIMEPVLDLARENEDKMLVTLWLHDGVYIHFFKDDRSQKLEKELQRRVNERAASANYPTQLTLVQDKPEKPLLQPYGQVI